MQNENLLEEGLSREELQTLRNRRAGMFIFQLSWIMAFVSLVVVNWQLRFSPQWKPEGTEEANFLLGVVATAVLVISTVLVKRGLDAVRTDQVRAFLLQWNGAIGLGVLFIGLMLYEWLTIEPGTKYALVFRLMTGFHMVHAFAIGVYIAFIVMRARAGHYGARNFWAVEAGAKLWYFVLVAWLLFYTVIYLV